MIDYLIESTTCLMAFYLVYLLFFRNDRHFIRNRFYLLLGLVMSLVIPLLNVSVNEVPWDIPEPMVAVSTVTLPQSEALLMPESAPKFDILMLLYWLGFGVATMYLLMRATLIYFWIRNCDEGTIQQQRVLLTDGKLPTASIFGFLFWNNKSVYNFEEEKAILAHEIQHIKQRHTLDLILVELTQVIWWFNPLLFFYKKSIKQQHEYLADAAAAKLITNTSYQQLMINEVSKKFELSLTHYFGTSSIKKRIKMLNQKNENMFSWTKSLIVVPVIALLLVVYSCEHEESLADKAITVTIKGLDVSRMLVEKAEGHFIEGLVTDNKGNPVEKVGLVFMNAGKSMFARSSSDGSYSVEWKEHGNIEDITMRLFKPLTNEEKDALAEEAASNEKFKIEYEKKTENGKTIIIGKVTSSESNKLLPGVNIILKGTKTGTITDLQGNFKLEVPASGTLEVSFIGYESKRVDF